MENSAIRDIVKGPFMVIGIITAVILVIMFFLKLPEIKSDENESRVWRKNNISQVLLNIPMYGWAH